MDSFPRRIDYPCPKRKQVIKHKSRDRISNLPLDIQHYILSFLDFTEVMKTSTLSKKWRLIWASVTDLNFCFKYFCDQKHCLANSYDEYLSKFWAFVKVPFVKRVATPIHRIQLKCDNFSCHQLNSLFVLCAMSNVQELELMAGHRVQHFPLHCPVHLDEGYKKNICNGVQWKYFRVFGGLKSLNLVRVQLFDAYITEYLFSNCGVLENLSLENCCFLMTKFLSISANKLRKLNFVNMMSTGRGVCKGIFEGRLKLHTPNLVSLSYEGEAILLLEFSDMVFLKHASIMVYCHSTRRFPELGAMGLGIHHVEELSVSAGFVLYLSPASGKPSRNFSQFGRLRWLKLGLQNTARHIEGLIKLLQLSPNLEVLHIEFHQIWIDRWKWTGMNVGFLSHNLKEIEIVVWHDSPDSLELIKFFLQNAKFLERIKFTQKLEKVNPERFYSLQGVKLASEEVSVSVTSISASGEKTMLFEIVYGKSGASVQTRTSKMKIRMRRSMRIAGKKSGCSS